jgi:1H-pyrrole-2-carbonyl-[peptidyl-carrier protein] brominase
MQTDVAIVGGGPGGAATAAYLSRAGISSVIIEKAAFPRFHIGESLTGECGNLLRELGLEEEMAAMGNPVKYGVRVIGPSGANSFWIPVKKRVPGVGLQDGFTWQVRRSDFDRVLLDKARSTGATVLSGRALAPMATGDGGVGGVRVHLEGGEEVDVESAVVVDASGQHTFLANAGITSRKDRGNYDRQIAIYSHFSGVRRDAGDAAGNTLIFFQKPHHWAWSIPIDGKTDSIGVVVPSAYYRSTGESKRDFLVREMAALNPDLASRVAGATLVEEVRASSNYSYHVREFSGRGWLCVGDSHRFIDPIFSFGVHLSISEAKMAAAAIERYLGGEGAGQDRPFLAYEQAAERGTDVFQSVLDGFWENNLAFAVLVHERYPEDFIDMFAGLVYVEHEYEGLRAIRKVLARTRGQHQQPVAG